ncbi:MAG: leucine-rich repeat protein [Bacteroidales bacterium]|nr:leucine-rich repeat protein [Bacteroidales bacterium]
MKKILLSFLSALVAIAASASVGDTFAQGSLAYRITAEPTSTSYGEVTVTGFSIASNAPNISNLAFTIPSSVYYSGKTYVVISVAQSAFANRTNISSVSINYGLRDLNASAFQGCTNLSYVRLPSSCHFIYSKVFDGCTNLELVYYALSTDPNNWIINTNAFPANPNMKLLVSKTNPNVVEQFRRKAAFQNFASIQTSEFANDETYVDGAMTVVTKEPTSSGHGEMTIVGLSTNLLASTVTNGIYKPAGPTYKLGPYTFDVVAVSDSAFVRQTSLKGFDVSNMTSLKTIGEYAFTGCSALENVTLNEGLTTIKMRAFNGCTKLKQLTLPSTVSDCAPSFVDGCSAISALDVASGNRYYQSSYYTLYTTDGTLVRCPEGCSYLTVLSSTKAIGDYAFYNCSKLSVLTVPYGVKTVGMYAFRNSSLSQILFPSSVTSISTTAFRDCANLASLTINKTSVLPMASTSFSSCKRTNLYVPKSAISAYKAAEGWKTWTNFNVGGYDVQTNAFDGMTNYWASYTIVSDKKEVINGVSYDGRARLVNVPGISTIAHLTIPEYVMENSKKYAVTSVGEDAASGSTFSGSSFSVYLGVNVDTVGVGAFKGITALKKLYLNPNLKYIANDAFNGCGITNDLIFPYGFKTLGNYALYANPVTRILLPSSLTSMGTYAISRASQLRELIINTKWVSSATTWDLTNIPSTCKLYVPTGCVQEYKNNTKWKNLQVSAGAYDFAYNDDHAGTIYRMTVVSGSPVTKDGVTYAGRAKYVYHPSLVEKGTVIYSTSTFETDKGNNANKMYLMTEFGDSCMAHSKVASAAPMKYLEAVGNYAFYMSNLTGSYELPSTCTYLGKWAFMNCKLAELMIKANYNNTVLPGQLFGNISSNFACYVKYDQIYLWQQAAKSWPVMMASGKLCSDSFNAYFEDSNDAIDISVTHPVNWNGSDLNAYLVTGFDASTNTLRTSQVNATPAGTGVLLTGYNKGKIYKLYRPSTTPAAVTNNYLMGTSTKSVDVHSYAYCYYFDTAKKMFIRPTAARNSGYGRTVLVYSTSASSLNVDLWGGGLKGDIDGNGVVNVSDVTALINQILGTASYPTNRCDVDGNGTVNVSDVTALINIILG